MSSRSRVILGNHRQHHRCSPSCTAADMPYRLLVAAIARASALDIRRAPAGPLVEPCPAISRPNIQSRRSRHRTQIGSSPSHEPGLLVFDRKRWEVTPPLPQAQRAQGLAAQEIFFDYVPTSSVTSRIVQDARDCLYSFDIPRSTSAPAVALRSPRNRSLSDVSQAPSTGSSSTLSHSKPMTICPRFNATLGFITLWQPCVDKTKRSS